MKDQKANRKISTPKLLFVDDDKISLDVVKRIFKDKYDCDCVMTSESALIKAKENDYDIFLLDIGLQGKMDGIQTANELKKIKNNKNKPYIAVTAYAMEDDKELILTKGLTHYLSKPFDSQKLIELIEAVLSET